MGHLTSISGEKNSITVANTAPGRRWCCLCPVVPTYNSVQIHWLSHGMLPFSSLSATQFPAEHIVCAEIYGLVLYYIEKPDQLSWRMSVCSAQPCLYSGQHCLVQGLQCSWLCSINCKPQIYKQLCYPMRFFTCFFQDNVNTWPKLLVL